MISYASVLFFVGSEMIVIILAILLLFGADKMPEFFRTFTKGMNELRKATDDIKKEFTESTNEIKSDLLDTQDELSSQLKEQKEEIVNVFDYEEVYGDINDEYSTAHAEVQPLALPKEERKKEVKEKANDEIDIHNDTSEENH